MQKPIVTTVLISMYRCGWENGAMHSPVVFSASRFHMPMNSKKVVSWWMRPNIYQNAGKINSHSSPMHILNGDGGDR